MIKKIFVVLLLLVLAGAAALFFAVRSIRPDKLKDEILSRVEEATGARLEVQAVRISIFPRLSVWVEGIKVASSPDDGTALFTAERVEVYPKLLPLLSGRVELDAIGLLKPVLALKKGRDGRLNLPSKAGGGPSSSRAGGGAPPAFRIARFVLRDGKFSFSDAASGDRFDLARIDAEVRDISMDLPIRFAGKAAFEGPALNLEASGTYGPFNAPLAERGLKTSVKLRLDQVNMDELKKKVRALNSLPLSGTPVLGSVSADIEEVEFSPAGELRGVRGDAAVDFKELRLDLFKTPLRDIAAKAVVKDEEISIDGGKASLGDGSFTFDLDATTVLTAPSVRFSAALRGVQVNDAMPLALHPEAPTFLGKLNADVSLEGRGANFADALAGVSGSGQFEVTEGTVRNLNLLSSVFEKIAAIPMIGVELRNSLSPRFRALATQRDMAIRLAQSRFTVYRGAVAVQQANVQGDEFLINGGGDIAPKGEALGLNGGLFLSQALSYEITGLAPDFAVLLDGSRQIFIPFSIVGSLSHPEVVVDKEYLTSKLMSTKGTELLGKVLKPGSDAGNSTGNILKNLIK